MSAEHAQIGSVLGPDGKIFRTRSGKSIKLTELLDEAVERAGVAFDEVPHKEPFDEETRRQVVEAVGMGAVKSADLSTARGSEYVFDFDRMISFRGNTGPYLQYATARIYSIFRRAASRRRRRSGRSCSATTPSGRSPCTSGLRCRRPRDRRDRRTAPAVHVPVRAGVGVHHLL